MVQTVEPGGVAVQLLQQGGPVPRQQPVLAAALPGLPEREKGGDLLFRTARVGQDPPEAEGPFCFAPAHLPAPPCQMFRFYSSRRRAK